MFQKVATIGQRILQYRELKDITLAQLEDITGSPAQTLNRYENSRRSPNIQTAQQLAETMGVNLLWLMGYDAPMYAALEDIALTADESEIVRCYRIMPPALKLSFLQMARSTAGTIPHEYVARDEDSWLYGSAAAFGGTSAGAEITKEGAAAFIEATNGKSKRKRKRVPKTTNE